MGTRSKEDISTLNKNLANLEQDPDNVKPKVTKKKKFKEKNSERIENDLFADENKPQGKSGKKSSTKKKRKKTEVNTNAEGENIELVPMTGTAQDTSGPRASVSEVEEEINVINDKESKRKKSSSKKMSILS